MVAIAPARLDPPSVPEPEPRRRLDRLIAPVSLVLLALPILARIVPAALTRPGASNFGDTASTEVAVQNALRLRQSLGPYDRFGWSHPGPIVFYLLAIPYRLMGKAALGLNVGAGLINLGAVVGVFLIVRRRIGTAAAVATAAIISAFLAVDGLSEMSHAWSPVVIRWPALLFVVCCADWAAFGGWSLLWSVLLGSFLVQTEVGLGPVVALALVLGLIMRLVRRDGADRLRVAVVAAAATVVVWIPTFIQEWSSPRGNLTVVIDFFTSHHAAHRFAHTFAGVADGMLSGIGPGRLDNVVLPDGNYTAPLVLLLLAGAAIAGLCLWRRQAFGFALSAGAVVLAAAYALSLTRAVDRLGGYLTVWAQALTVGIAVAAAALVVRGRVLTAVALIALAGVAGYQAYAGAASPLKDAYATVTIAARATERRLGGADRHLLLCTASVGTWPHAEGVLADLRRDGYDARVQQRWQFTDPELAAPSGREHTALVVQLLEHGVPLSPITPTRPLAIIRGGGLRVLVYRSSAPVTEQLCPPVNPA